MNPFHRLYHLPRALESGGWAARGGTVSDSSGDSRHRSLPCYIKSAGIRYREDRLALAPETKPRSLAASNLTSCDRVNSSFSCWLFFSDAGS
ncbi:hypothetical protein BHM03_00033656 [Ensete ventricosum]|nr:hypothetical protein BHM03_00033656 [Ensete ventricosum]